MKRFARLNLKENSAMTTYTAANPADTSVRCGELTRTTAGSAASAPSLTRARGLRSAGALTNSEIRLTSKIVRPARIDRAMTNDSTALVVWSVTRGSRRANRTKHRKEMTMLRALNGRNGRAAITLRTV